MNTRKTLLMFLAGVATVACLGAASNISSLIGLSDVTDADATSGHVLRANGTSWVSTTLGTDDLVEGVSNLFYTDERTDDRANALIVAGTGITKTYNDGANTLTIANSGVTSVGLSMPSIFSVSGSPVTTTGTLTASLANQTANTIWAGPSSGGATTPSFRALVAGDIPSLDASKIGSGTLLQARGGTGFSTYTTGDILYASATDTLAKLSGNTTTTKKFLRQTGTGSASAAPVWDTIASSDVTQYSETGTGIHPDPADPDTSLGTTYAQVVFVGATDPEFSVPSTGKYLLMSTVIVTATGGTTQYSFKLRNLTDGADISNSEKVLTLSQSSGENAEIVLMNVASLTSGKTIALFGKVDISTYSPGVKAKGTSLLYVKIGP